MKQKAPLSLMEQLVMLLVFAFSAALCLQIYVLSSQISRRCEAQGHAVVLVQNTAEAIKFCHGDTDRYPQYLGGTGDAGQWQIGYDETWTVTSLSQAHYFITVNRIASSVPTLGQAIISAHTSTGTELFGLTVFWQEVACE